MKKTDVCPLLADLGETEKAAARAFFHAREKEYKKGEILKFPVDALCFFGTVLSGTVHVTMTDMNGSTVLLAAVSPGQTFGESLCYLKQASPVQITAVTEARVLEMDCESLRRAPANDLEHRLFARFCRLLAERTLRMNDRVQVLSRLSIREKLSLYFAQRVRDTGRNAFRVPFDREGMAVYLGVNRTALSRELGKMKAEGLIDFNKNRFEMLNFVAFATDKEA